MVANNAGKPATPADLINVDEVIGKYYDLVPDPAVPEQRVIFGTSGHRGSSLKTSFNEAHIVAITQAIAEYRKKAGVTGPLYLGRATHALSGPAEKTAIEVLVANGVHVRVDSRGDFVPTPVVSQAILTHNRAADGTLRYNFFDSLRRDPRTGMPHGEALNSAWISAPSAAGLLAYLGHQESSMRPAAP